MYRMYVKKLIIIVAIVATTSSCSRHENDYIEGTVTLFMAYGGFTEEGINMTAYKFLLSNGVYYELDFQENCIFVGFDNSGKGIIFKIKGKEKGIALEEGVKYKARGEVSDAKYQFDHNPTKSLKVNYFERLASSF